ncbi:MAG TPA: ABC transporter substrate-binding protein [Anaerolineaceae bacterium]|nr:ABC transporter substrate-binding protein [Anaerolineaceae bacterium]HPC06332.1 ABC transporter substrate-binding protein [Anaerolineaceae bacterium]HQN04983.1 ABC transporter substrate-binding protein [Anaerolineaceae bacterium]HQP08662.1 ABC transporter substrate-binding protein [Anaerolineaceae bacterium]
MKKSILVLVITVLLLSACGGGGSETSSGGGGSVDADGNVTLDFWYALGGDSGKAIEELVNQFNASHPNIKVVGTYQGNYTTAMAKVYSAITGNTLPNVAQLGAAPLLGSSGAVLPVKDFLATDSSFDLEKIHPAFLQYNTAAGELWSLPFNNSVPILLYNKDLFVAAGLDPEDPPEDIDELLEYAKALTIKDNNGIVTQYGLNTKDDTHWYLSTLFLENGAQIVSEDESEMLYNSPEAVAMLQTWSDWVNVDQVMPRNQHAEAQSDFLAGKLGMLMGSTSGVSGIQKDAAFRVGSAMFPMVNGVRKVPVGGGSLVLFKNENEQIRNASWEFVKFMISEQSSIYLTSKTGYIPIYKDALNWPEIESIIEDNPLRLAAINSLPYAVAIPVFSALGNSDLALQNAIEKVELGSADPQTALDEAKTSVDHAIKTQFSTPSP